ERLPDADADDFRAVTLPAARALLLPAELARTHLERLAKMRAGHAALPGTETRRAVRRVDAPDLEPVDAELARGLVDQRLDGRRDLVLARAALRTARRRVRQHRHAAEAHRGRRIDERYRVCRRLPVVEAGVRAVLLDDEQIRGRQPAVLREAE